MEQKLVLMIMPFIFINFSLLVFQMQRLVMQQQPLRQLYHRLLLQLSHFVIDFRLLYQLTKTTVYPIIKLFLKYLQLQILIGFQMHKHLRMHDQVIVQQLVLYIHLKIMQIILSTYKVVYLFRQKPLIRVNEAMQSQKHSLYVSSIKHIPHHYLYHIIVSCHLFRR